MNRMRRAALKRLGMGVAAAPMPPGAVVGAATANLGAAQTVWKALRRDVEWERERAAWLQTALLGVVDADIQAMESLSVTAKARMMARRSIERGAAARSWNERLWGNDE